MGAIWSWLIGEDLSAVDVSSIHVNCHVHHVNYKKSEETILTKVQLVTNRYALITDVINELQSHEKFRNVDIDLSSESYKVVVKYVTYSKDNRLCCIGVNDYDRIEICDKNQSPRGMSHVIEDINQNQIIFSNNKSTEHIVMKSLHVSCRSHKIDCKSNYIGLILYSYNKKNDWKLNGVHCKAGYIIIRKSKQLLSDLENASVKFEPDTKHSRLYYWLFKQLPDENIIGGGFGIQDGQIKFNSTTFNKNTSKKNSGVQCVYHDAYRVCHQLEEKWIKIALKNWKNGEQNTFVEEPKDICWECIVKVHTVYSL
eukprot:507499_1